MVLISGEVIHSVNHLIKSILIQKSITIFSLKIKMHKEKWKRNLFAIVTLQLFLYDLIFLVNEGHWNCKTRHILNFVAVCKSIPRVSAHIKEVMKCFFSCFFLLLPQSLLYGPCLLLFFDGSNTIKVSSIFFDTLFPFTHISANKEGFFLPRIILQYTSRVINRKNTYNPCHNFTCTFVSLHCQGD